MMAIKMEENKNDFEILREEHEIKRSAPKKLRAACKTFKKEYADIDFDRDEADESILSFNDRS
jgi:hypothetical protein